MSTSTLVKTPGYLPVIDAPTFSSKKVADFAEFDEFGTDVVENDEYDGFIVTDRPLGAVDGTEAGELATTFSYGDDLTEGISQLRDSLRGGEELGVWGNAMRNIVGLFLEAHVADLASRVTSEEVSAGWFRDRQRGAHFESLGIFIEGLNAFPGDSRAIGSVIGLKNGYTLAREERAAKAQARREAQAQKAAEKAAEREVAREAARKAAAQRAIAARKAAKAQEAKAARELFNAQKAEALAKAAAKAEARKAEAAAAAKAKAIAKAKAKKAAATVSTEAAAEVAPVEVKTPNKRRRGGRGRGPNKAATPSTSTPTTDAPNASTASPAKKRTRRGGKNRNRSAAPAAVSAS